MDLRGREARWVGWDVAEGVSQTLIERVRKNDGYVMPAGNDSDLIEAATEISDSVPH